MTHGMIDIETLGTKPGCIVLSVGAVLFNPFTGEKSAPFYMNVKRDSCEQIGLVADPKTVEWWSKQSPQAHAHLVPNQMHIKDVMTFLLYWFKLNKVEKFWCQGATFDAPILEHVYNLLGIEVPWKFYNVRDTRTVYDICGLNDKSVPREGTYHNALDDAIHQVKCVYTAIKTSGRWAI